MAKKNKVLKIDLSRYNGSERLPSDIEKIVINLLLTTDFNIKKVSANTYLDDETINRVFIKWYMELTKIENTKINSSELENSINNAITIINEHLDEFKRFKDNARVKRLTSDETRNINSLLDRLTKLREAESKTYQNLITDLNNSILKAAETSLKENGPIEDNSEYENNVATVLSQLSKYDKPIDDVNKDDVT